MNPRKYKIIVAGLALPILMVSVFFFEQDSVAEKQNNKIKVTASFYPLAYLASAVGGDFVTVVNLTPPGAEPHDFEPSPRDIEMLSKTDVFIYNGGNFEPWIKAWEGGSFSHPQLTVNMIGALTTKKVELIESRSATDPHVWLDPRIMAGEAEILKDTLIAIDPAHEFVYRENTSRFVEELNSLDAHYRKVLSTCSIRDMVVSHEAFAYLARAYDLSMIPIAGLSPDEEPSPKTLAFISDLALEKNIKYIFFEAIANPKLAETIAREIGAETLVLNTLESLTVDELRGGEDYISIMEQNLNNLTKALVCQ